MKPVAEIPWPLCVRIGGTSNRKWRLFVCACCRRVWPHTKKPWQKVVEVMEEFSDGLATKAQASKVIAAAGHLEDNWRTPASCLRDTLHILRMTDVNVAARSAMRAVEYGGIPPRKKRLPRGEQARQVEEAAQVALLRDVFGHFPVTYPKWRWTPVPIDPVCRTPTVVALAQAAYELRALPSGELDLIRLGILADALEEAGCTDQPLLDHLRGPGPHVRGCWALDLVLGKE
jgi:hypothetical protein